MFKKSKKIKLIFFIYWFLLLYIFSALIWWYIALSRQNTTMANFKKNEISKQDAAYSIKVWKIEDERKRKTAQYLGEGSIFFLLISAGAIFLFRAVNKQLIISRQQQNFMVAITHELKTPIAITKLNLETLQKRQLDDAQQFKIIGNTIQESNRMNALCNNLLLSSQMEAGAHQFTPEKLDVKDVLETMISDFINRFPNRSIQFLGNGPLYLMGDVFLLQMAFNNLIDNAIKYSPKDKPIEIKIENQQNQCMITFADYGSGIQDGDKKKVFEKFYRIGTEATQKAKGTGLGLYLVHRIIKAHKGKVFITDNEPNGAKFVIQLKTVA
jgi:signal transduction histidine kinase